MENTKHADLIGEIELEPVKLPLHEGTMRREARRYSIKYRVEGSADPTWHDLTFGQDLQDMDEAKNIIRLHVGVSRPMGAPKVLFRVDVTETVTYTRQTFRA